MLSRAIELGDSFAASMLAWTRIAQRKHEEARRTLEADCARGNGQSCSLLGGLLSRCDDGRAPGMTPGDVEVCKTFPKPDIVGSTVAFEHACRNGYVGACVHAGRRYKQGAGVEADTVRAVELLELGCPKGWYACAELGAMYEFGAGVAKDLPRAFLTYDKACQQNQKTECYYAARVAGELDRGVAVARRW